ncbi:UDP-N-acetylmuramoyl-L-alanyl-D-glutamate--2,6-diaminopimelate ligase [Phaeovulum vinaykumarii]|uniref:UDP-N-acetylmuramoyl-L-alanyl-D-glutamate--2,6-diaminopimelate ligase n=1 Tax=Phaeovulum vinaykumarii TaxID=407234 RepID=A0A1N7JTG9_9RHOB|nr:UDP-N-acetylmuramoyl-L-alanyl-D-glutamate--2,6-diaminopimelate ligase [Phaeovulum vinaykumarii]SIS52640.1 UDP-N-acetylmuramoylalanyl-D-glutamate--2,6-diaminopimelate ligase [Phaeovulum vinaykumarii]SOB91305.1 UDP-N-acetylmuramoylalanyl-D-glutamate--2,6-diaminopimelate ligase [Phaeovulum vinaykumarii]
MAETTKTLGELGLTGPDSGLAVTGLCVDSRLARPGVLFAALPGTRAHGADFAPAAIEKGAAAVLTDRRGAEILRAGGAAGRVAIVVAEDPRQTLAMAAALWFGAQPQTMVAVTGTNGKTSVASFTRQIWQALGFEAANIGTTGVEGAFSAPTGHTTPEPITLHHLLAQMAQAGVTHAAMEASSHGLAQCRLDGVRLSAAAFTNLSQDHLDYHPSLDAYFDAKAGLFTRVLPEDGVAVVNFDDDFGMELALAARGRGQQVFGVGYSDRAEMRISHQRYDATGQDLRFYWRGQVHLKRLNLIGGFQAGNVLTAAGLAIACGAEAEAVFDALPKLETVRGRMQLAATRANGATVFVDYAHTPEAISTAVKALRPHVMGRIVAVIGAGGDRDTTKRVLMGRAAAETADVVFVTDDNPRTEDPAAIRAAVMAGCPEATEVGDRAEAILRAVDALGPGDAALICGKGHETGQVIGTDIYPFDDAEQASVAVAALDGTI